MKRAAVTRLRALSCSILRMQWFGLDTRYLYCNARFLPRLLTPSGHTRGRHAAQHLLFTLE